MPSSPRWRALAADVAPFLVGGALLFATIDWAMPAAIRVGLAPLVAWMLLSIPLVFLPIVGLGVLLLRAEHDRPPWRDRLRLRRFCRRDLQWGLLGLVGIAAGSGLMFRLVGMLGLDPHPPFARGAQTVTGEQLWMVGLWALYWPINMLGEEFVWRAVLLPRMESHLGARAWLLNAVSWGVFHAAFGSGNILVLIPTLILVPFFVQKCQNTWIGVLVHSALSLGGFMSIAFGWAPA